MNITISVMESFPSLTSRRRRPVSFESSSKFSQVLLTRSTRQMLPVHVQFQEIPVATHITLLHFLTFCNNNKNSNRPLRYLPRPSHTHTIRIFHSILRHKAFLHLTCSITQIFHGPGQILPKSNGSLARKATKLSA